MPKISAKSSNKSGASLLGRKPGAKMLLLPVAAVLALVVSVGGYVSVRHASAATCEYVKDSGTGGEIAGNGVNAPVSLVSGKGNVFCLVWSGKVNFNGQNLTWYSYENGYGHCLFVNGSTLDLGGACHHDSNHPNEEMVGEVDTSTGWVWNNVGFLYAGNGGEALQPNSCSIGSHVSVNANYEPNCQNWTFPHTN